MFLRQISPRIFLKMSFFSLYVQNLFFRRTLMILKIDTRLGSEIKRYLDHGGTVNSCTALTPSRQNKKCLNLVLFNVGNRRYIIPHTKSQIVNGRLQPHTGYVPAREPQIINKFLPFTRRELGLPVGRGKNLSAWGTFPSSRRSPRSRFPPFSFTGVY